MAEKVNSCVFCGEGLSMLNRKTIYCCTTQQPACKDCYAKLISLPREEQGRRALATGRAVDADKLRSFRTMREKNAREKAEAEERAQKGRISDKACPQCGVPLMKMGQHKFQLGEFDPWMGTMSLLAAGSLPLDVLYCPQCRKVDFFLPEEFDPETF